MTDTQIQCFLTLAENLNYTKTAQLIGISQSTLSAHIAALEKCLHYKLFVRNKRNVTLSLAGEIFYKTFRETTSLIDEAMRTISQMEADNQSCITIGLMEGQWSKAMLENISGAFFDARKSMKFVVKTFGNAELLEQLELGNVDMILGYSNVLNVRKDLESVPLYETPFYIVKRSDYRKDIMTDKHFLENQCFILQHKSVAPFFENYYETFCRLKEIFPTNIVRVSNNASIMLNVEMGRGVGLIDDLSIIFGKTQYEFEKIPDMIIKYDLIYKPGHIKNLLSEYIEYLKDNYSERISNSILSAGL